MRGEGDWPRHHLYPKPPRWATDATRWWADVAGAPLVAGAVRQVDAILTAERTAKGLPAEQRLAGVQQQIASLVAVKGRIEP